MDCDHKIDHEIRVETEVDHNCKTPEKIHMNYDNPETIPLPGCHQEPTIVHENEEAMATM